MYDPRETSGASRSLWVKAAWSEADDFGHSVREIASKKIDVIVVGAGITGLSTAYHLVVAGLSVVVIDRGRIARGETSRSTAHACTALDDRYVELAKMHGEDGARLAATSHAQAITSIESIAAAEGIDCGFERVDGYLFAGDPRDGAQEALLQAELAAARLAGLEVEPAPTPPLSFPAGSVLRFRNQAQLDPVQYTRGLARAVQRRGGRFLLDARVVKVDETKPVVVHLEDGNTLQADHIVVATNTPIIDVLAMHTKQAAYRSYAMAFAIEPGSVERALYWDTATPYHYVRVANGGSVLIVGGEDHKVGQSSEPEQAWVRLEAWTRSHFPQATQVLHRWSGQIWEPMDGLAFIGRNPGSPSNVLIATGDSGNGITHGALAGIMLSDRITGKENAFQELYDPSRKTTKARSTRAMLRENLNVAVSYGGHITSAIDNRTAPHELPPGDGMIVRRGLRRIGRYRDEAGVEHECSAVCTHLGGPLHWNSAEQSWDCPCHGARFDPYGRVITGPAVKDLEQIEPLVPAVTEVRVADDAAE